MSPARVRARQAAIRELEQDFAERGGYETTVREGVPVEDRRAEGLGFLGVRLVK